jgi:hypothetical protein
MGTEMQMLQMGCLQVSEGNKAVCRASAPRKAGRYPSGVSYHGGAR